MHGGDTKVDRMTLNVLNTSKEVLVMRVGGYKETKCVIYKQGGTGDMGQDKENEGLIALNMSEVGNEAEIREPHMH